MAGADCFAGCFSEQGFFNGLQQDNLHCLPILRASSYIGNKSILLRWLAYIAYTKVCFQYRQIQLIIKVILHISELVCDVIPVALGLSQTAARLVETN